MKLDLSALEKALASLDKALTRATGAPGDEELRDAVIHNAAKAQSVFATTRPFLADARSLLTELQRRNDD